MNTDHYYKPNIIKLLIFEMHLGNWPTLRIMYDIGELGIHTCIDVDSIHGTTFVGNSTENRWFLFDVNFLYFLHKVYII